MRMEMATVWIQLGSLTATLMFLKSMFNKFAPHVLRDFLRAYTDKLILLMSPYIHITFREFTGDGLKCSEAFTAVQTYLSDISSQRATRLKAEFLHKRSQTPLVLTMDDNQEITDEFQGVKLWWGSYRNPPPKTLWFSAQPASDKETFLTLTFHKRHRDLITHQYIRHVLDEAEAITSRNRQLKLHTNKPSRSWYDHKSKWRHVVFEHPATFDTLALHPKKKEAILSDLVKFQNGKNYYAKMGKPWKRGYLLYGPPGTGKSTMVAAMANFLKYDIYDLELTTVTYNSDLRKLLIETPSKSITVIEDIDCSLDLTGQRKKLKDKEEQKPRDSKVTLSGLLNFIDGIWSSCGGERIIVFTTNFVDKLDPALVRRGRMDMHIELSYCCYEAFMVLAKNYLDLETHHLFSRIEQLLKETQMTTADVAENLMPKSLDEDKDSCLERLVEALETAKEEAKKKAEEGSKEKDQSSEQEVEMKEKSGEGVKDQSSEQEVNMKDKSGEGVKDRSSVQEVKMKDKSGEEVKENGFH